MRKVFSIIIVLITVYSCNTFLDRGKNLTTDYIDFNYFENHNEFIYKSKVNAIADKEVYYPIHFKIDLPKNIKNWQSSSSELYFEYAAKQIIFINSGFKNNGVINKWILKNTDENEVYSKLISYWNKKKYDENDLKINQSNRISKIYTDGKVSILFYNIKQENFEKYLALAKNFKYLN